MLGGSGIWKLPNFSVSKYFSSFTIEFLHTYHSVPDTYKPVRNITGDITYIPVFVYYVATQGALSDYAVC